MRVRGNTVVIVEQEENLFSAKGCILSCYFFTITTYLNYWKMATCTSAHQGRQSKRFSCIYIGPLGNQLLQKNPHTKINLKVNGFFNYNPTYFHEISSNKTIFVAARLDWSGLRHPKIHQNQSICEQFSTLQISDLNRLLLYELNTQMYTNFDNCFSMIRAFTTQTYLSDIKILLSLCHVFCV